MPRSKRTSYEPHQPVPFGRGEDALLEAATADIQPKKPERKLIRRTYYLWPEQLLWLKQRRFDRECDGSSPDDATLSAIVREALDAYIAEQEG